MTIVPHEVILVRRKARQMREIEASYRAYSGHVSSINQELAKMSVILSRFISDLDGPAQQARQVWLRSQRTLAIIESQDLAAMERELALLRAEMGGSPSRSS